METPDKAATPPAQPQTADQINGPQTGAAKLTPAADVQFFPKAPATPEPVIKAAAVLAAKPTVTVVPLPMEPKGWWKLPGWNGSRQGVKLAISKSDCPAHWAAAIQTQIDALDAKFNLIKVDAHYHRHDDNKETLHLTLSPSVGVV